jgi:uncharacterized protein (DUF1684 family)
VTAVSRSVCGTVLLVLALLVPSREFAAASVPGDSAADYPDFELSSHEAEIIEWRRLRLGRLTDPEGWLTLVGLDWLREGNNRVGSADTNDIRIPGGPADWGTITLANNELIFEPAAQSGVTIDGAPARRVRLVPDNEGEPTVVRHGDLSFYVIMRGSYALRVKDRQAPTLLAFDGVENYPIDPGWRVEARFFPAQPGQTIEIANVLGQTESMAVGGTVEFERDGQNYRLLGVLEKDVDSLWFLIADRTSGRETYGAGRFLYSNGMPENGRLVLDFNKAYNPPCAFNAYSTCPLPPQQNRLDLAVTAGERGYHHQ